MRFVITLLIITWLALALAAWLARAGLFAVVGRLSPLVRIGRAG